MDVREGPSYRGRPMGAAPPNNVDLLEWFSEDERELCSDCGERACVGFPGLEAIDGETITLN